MKTQSKQKRFHLPDDLEGIWQILYPKHFINELLIHHPKQRGEKEIEEVASFMRSDYEYINRFASTHKTHNSIRSIDISDIFESIKHEDDSLIEPKLILIDGAPGMGKTTLCKEIAYQWANGKLLKSTKIIFLLFLRDPALQRMHDLKDFIHYFYNFEPTYLDLSKQCADILTKRDNSDVTILMDGYDEFQDKQNNLLVQNIIERYVLSQCRIVITSRPIASENLHKFANVRVEILGFTEQSKIKYIDTELKDDPIKVISLLSYLNNHSDINKVCYIPIMMTIMVCTFKEYEELPTNQSELYERFVTLVISRCLQKLGNTSIASLNLLPEKYYSYLEKLSEFAYKTIEIDKIIFNDKDIEKVIPNFASPSKELQGLGLFRATEHSSIKAMGTCVWYNFLHLSLHEFLAAYYLKLLDPSEQFKILKKTFFIKRYVNVWAMFIGLQQKAAYDFHRFLIYSHIHGASDAAKDRMKVTLENSNFLYFSGIEIKCIDIKNITGTFQLLCCKNNVDNLHAGIYMTQENYIRTYDSWYLLHCTSNWTKVFVSLCSIENNTSDQLIEVYLLDKNTQDNLYHQIVAELEQNLSLSVMLVSDNTLVGYRINCNQLTNALIMNGSIESVILRDCLISDDIANILSSHFVKYHNLKHLCITDCTIESNQPLLLGILQAISKHSELMGLNVSCSNINTQDLEAVVIKSQLTLKHLSLAYNNIGSSVVGILQTLTKLDILNLNSNKITGQKAKDLANIIEKNSDLEHLDLGNNDLGSTAIIILQALKDNCKLKTLNLDNNNMTGLVAEELANVIKNNSNLEHLNLKSNDLGPTATNLILQALKESCKLKTLNLNDNNMTGEVSEELANVIKNNWSLAKLYLSDNDIKSSATVIFKILKENTMLRELHFNNNFMTGEVVEGLASVIKNNSNLKQLSIADNDLKSSASVILQALKENSKLTGLNLNNNNMTGQVAEDLANVIKNNTDLETLALSYNDLRSSAIIILQALKENSKIKFLHLDNNNMGGQVAKDLANVIRNNPGLVELFISGNDFESSASVILKELENRILKKLHFNNKLMTKEVAEDLARVINKNSGLEEIFLSDINFKSSGIILQALKKNVKIGFLKLNNNTLTRQAVENLASVIKNNCNLETLALHSNALGPSATVILRALKVSTKLKRLNLNDNSMTRQVAEDLANVIKNNSNLEMLCLRNNELGLSAIKILQALKDNSKLIILDLNDNNMTGQVSEDLANVIKNNSGLERIHLFNNDLRSSATVILQALQKNSNLQFLDLGDNGMTEQVIEELGNVIKNNHNLKNLGLGNNEFGPSAKMILQALVKTSTITTLFLHNNNMTGQVAESLGTVIKNNSNLEQLDLESNNIGPSAIVILQALMENSKLKALNLNSNYMTGRVVKDLANVIKNNYNLQKLGLENNNFGPSASVILQALKNSQLEVLNLSNNNMTGQVAEDLANVIQNNSGLEELYVSNNNLGPSACMILQALKQKSNVKILYLHNTFMTGKIVEELANVIKYNSDLEQLGLENNKLRPSATVILQALKENSQLKVLNLSNNNMTGQVAEDLANVIQNNSGLEELYVSNNNLGPSACMILQALKQKSNVKILYLHNTFMTGKIVEELANVIKCNSNLEQLGLEDNKLGPSATVILQALKENSQLKVLNLNNNNMTRQVAEDLANVIKNHCNLEKLFLANNNLGPSAIVILQALLKNSKLNLLNLTSNNMTGEIAVDLVNVIKNNTDLEELSLSNNNLNSSAIVILQTLKLNHQLSTLNMSNSFLTECTAAELVSVIKNNPFITKLWLGDNMLQSGVIDIAVSCKSLTHLLALELSCNMIDPIAVVHLASIVTKINSLHTLIFGSLVVNVKERICLDVYQFSDSSKQNFLVQNNDTEMLEFFCIGVWRSWFVDKVKFNYNIRNYFPTLFSYNYKKISFIDIKPNLSTIVEQSKQKLFSLDATNMIISLFDIIESLTVLDLEYSNINKEAAIKLATALNCNNVLEQLWLRGNVLGADGAAVILTSLQKISTLRILDLSYNNISSTSANGIAAVINSNQFLEQLWLDGNTLMTTGVITIASVLKKHSNLRLLSLSNNGITEDAAGEISTIVNSNTLLGSLLLSNNQLKSIGTCKIAKSLGAIQFLHILELTNNCIDATAADELALMLFNCLCLRELYLGNNNLETTGAVKVCQALKNIQILRVLSLNNNNITTEAASEICNVISTNTNLDILLLGGNDLQITGALQIADTVKNNNPTMQLLSLSDNNINEQEKEDIKVKLCNLKLYV